TSPSSFTHYLLLVPHSLFFFLTLRRPPPSPLFPYTTLFRSTPSFPPADFSAGAALLLCSIRRSARCRTNSPPTKFPRVPRALVRSEEHTSELQSPCNLVCRLLLEKKKKKK